MWKIVMIEHLFQENTWPDDAWKESRILHDKFYETHQSDIIETNYNTYHYWSHQFLKELQSVLILMVIENWYVLSIEESKLCVGFCPPQNEMQSLDDMIYFCDVLTFENVTNCCWLIGKYMFAQEKKGGYDSFED